MSVSQRVREWVDRYIAEHAPGTRFPHDRPLAEHLGCSIVSVRRVMSDYAARGLVQRRSRSGTRIPPVDRSPGPGAVAAGGKLPLHPTSVESIRNDMLDAIAAGTYKKGTALPPNKQVSLELHVGTRTVTAAYRMLEREGYVTKVGRQYRVGGVCGTLNRGARRECVVLFPDSLALASLLRYSPRDMTAYNLSMALRKMESHLEAQGWHLAYKKYSELRALAGEWKGRGYLPDGFLLFGTDQGYVNAANFQSLHPTLSRIASSMHVPLPRSLAIVKDFIATCPGFHFFSVSHTSTARGRATAEFALTLQPAHFTVVIREDFPIGDIFNFLRIYPEIRGAGTNMNMHVLLISDDPERAPARLIERLYSNYGFEHMKKRLAVGGVLSREDFEGLFGGTGSVEDAVAGTREPTMFVFRDDSDAAEALEVCSRNTIRPGKDAFLLSYENNPDYFGQGITACISDWETDGYLMAHALIGDIPIATTSRGFIRARARILRRLTS